MNIKRRFGYKPIEIELTREEMLSASSEINAMYHSASAGEQLQEMLVNGSLDTEVIEFINGLDNIKLAGLLEDVGRGIQDRLESDIGYMELLNRTIRNCLCKEILLSLARN